MPHMLLLLLLTALPCCLVVHCTACLQDYNVSLMLYRARQRAIQENIQYMEIMLMGPPG